MQTLMLNFENRADMIHQMEEVAGRKFEIPGTPARVVTDAVVVEEVKGPRKPRAAKESPTPPSEPAASPTAEAAPAPAPSTAPDNAAASATPTKEQVRAKLAQVAELDGGKGLAEATKIVNAAGYQKVGSIEEKDYAAIIAACDARLAGSNA